MAGELPEGRDETDLEQEQLGAQRRPPLSRGARWQFGLSAFVALAWSLLAVNIPRSTSAFDVNPVYLPLMPAEVVGQLAARQVAMAISRAGLAVGEALSLPILLLGASEAVFGLYTLLLIPLRLWVDRPHSRTRYVKYGRRVAIGYVLSCALIYAFWWATENYRLVTR